MSRLRVLVVEDSITVRKRIVEVLSQTMEVIAEAEDGKTAIELCERLRPDVITMDMMLPVLTGVEATEHIMAYCPVPILIVSASTNRGELFKTYDALAAGAVDVLDKSVGNELNGDWERRLVAAVKMVSKIKVITHPRMRFRDNGAPRAVLGDRPPLHATPAAGSVVAVGASTGGPRAVLTILQQLPATFAPPVLLVIHIAEPFSASFADWLGGQVALDVRYARDGERLNNAASGTVLMAKPGYHMQVRDQLIEHTQAPERHSCRPSVDVLFESVAHEYGRNAVGCLLTGMGKDGAAGLGAIRRAGGMTIAQDEATSVVFGMPGEAVRLGAAVGVLPLNEIGPALVALSEERMRKRRTQ